MMVNMNNLKEDSWKERTKTNSFLTSNYEKQSFSSINSQQLQYDILLIYDADDDYYYAQDLLDLLQTKQLHIFDFAKDCPPGPSQREMFASALKASLYTCIVVTRNFINNFWLKFKTEMAIQNMLQNSEKQNSLIVVVMDPGLRLDDLPLELQVLSPLLRRERYFMHRFQKSFSGLPFQPEPGQFGSSMDRKTSQFPRSLQSNYSVEAGINCQHSMPHYPGQGNAGTNPSFKTQMSRRLPQEHDASLIVNNKFQQPAAEAVDRHQPNTTQMTRHNTIAEENDFHTSFFSCEPSEQHQQCSSQHLCGPPAYKALSDDQLPSNRTQHKQNIRDHERIQLQHPSSQFSSGSIQRRRTEEMMTVNHPNYHQRQLFQQSISSPEFGRRESQQHLMDLSQERRMNFIPQVENFKSSDFGSYRPMNRNSHESSISNQIFNNSSNQCGSQQSTMLMMSDDIRVPNDQHRISCDQHRISCESTQHNHANKPSITCSRPPSSSGSYSQDSGSQQMPSTYSGNCQQPPLESSSTGCNQTHANHQSFQTSSNNELMMVDSIDDIEVEISTDSSLPQTSERQKSIVSSFKSSISKLKKKFK